MKITTFLLKIALVSSFSLFGMSATYAVNKFKVMNLSGIPLADVTLQLGMLNHKTNNIGYIGRNTCMLANEKIFTITLEDNNMTLVSFKLIRIDQEDLSRWDNRRKITPERAAYVRSLVSWYDIESHFIFPENNTQQAIIVIGAMDNVHGEFEITRMRI